MNMLPRDFGIEVDTEGIIVTTSRAVAERFGKEHSHVLRDIEEINSKIFGGPKLDREIYRRSSYVDDRGKSQPSYIITRSGFMLLAMGYTGVDAFAIKLLYIQAFDLMEAALRGQWKDGLHWKEAQELLGRAVKGIGRLELHCEKISDDTGDIRRMVKNPRREISTAVKALHIDAIQQLGGRCPCCGLTEIVKAGARVPGMCEFDHFFSNQIADVSTTWPICIDCHRKLTTGELKRDDAESRFHAYQDHRRELPERQSSLLTFFDPKRRH